MMKLLLFIWLSVGSITSISTYKQNLNRHSFSVDYSRYTFGSGRQLIIKVTQDSILLTNWSGDKDSITYRSFLEVEKAERYYRFLKSLHLDTLKGFYYRYASDGSQAKWQVAGDSLSTKEITITNFYPEPYGLKQLFNETMKLLPQKKSWIRKYLY